jgi:hypothetical protein
MKTASTMSTRFGTEIGTATTLKIQILTWTRVVVAVWVLVGLELKLVQ